MILKHFQNRLNNLQIPQIKLWKWLLYSFLSPLFLKTSYVCIYVCTVAGCWGKLEENVGSCGIGVKAIVSLCRCWDSKPGQILVLGIFLVTMYLGSLNFLFSPSSFLVLSLSESWHLKAHLATISRVVFLPSSISRLSCMSIADQLLLSSCFCSGMVVYVYSFACHGASSHHQLWKYQVTVTGWLYSWFFQFKIPRKCVSGQPVSPFEFRVGVLQFSF